MLVIDLIAELKKFPEMSTVFVDTDERGVCRLDSAQEIWVKQTVVAGIASGSYVEIEQVDGRPTDDATDYGVLLIG